ncbi:AEC family transporter [Humidisolicoccus flavus]|uniref:AEC family transporter n=1 Tax=Humidisolicoccus flavus TaxID=3111414 RepID=UPI003244651A
MGGVLAGFSIIAVVILVGWLLAVTKVVTGDARFVLNRTAFFATTPALLFTVLANADMDVMLSPVLLVNVIAFVVVAVVYFVVARLWFTKDPGALAIGAYSSGYTNVNNIGLPVAAYVIGDVQYIAPLLMVQLVILAPTLLGFLDVRSRGKASFWSIISQPIRNPMLIAGLLGLVVALTDFQVPEIVMAPIDMLAGAAVPMVLLAFGVSLVGQKPMQPGTGRKEILLATVLKGIIMPVVAYVVAAFILQLDPQLVYAATIMAALPTAQNMYQFAIRYETGMVVSRDTVLLTTFLSLPVMFAIAALLHVS